MLKLLLVLMLASLNGAIWSCAGENEMEIISCALDPETIEGPYYLNVELKRSDVTEGRKGLPLKLEMFIMDSEKCEPLVNARVDIWQCDANGIYSAFADIAQKFDTRGQKFLRGTQYTNDKGGVIFRTIFPGWYPGRSIHIHHVVYINGKRKITGQIYFTEKHTKAIQQVEPYSSRIEKDPKDAPKPNYNDTLFTRDDGIHSMLTNLKGNTIKGYLGVIYIGIDLKHKQHSAYRSYNITKL